MKRRVGAVAGWIAATLVSVLVASAAVATVQDQVTERPSPLRPAALDRLASSTTAPTTTGTVPSSTDAEDLRPPVSATTSSPSSSMVTSSTADAGTSAPTTASTTAATPPTTTASQATSSTTTTTTNTAAPTTSTTGEPGELETYETEGGWVNILVYEDAVVLQGWTVASGYEIDIESAGPPQVELEFKSQETTWSFKAEIEDGELDVRIDREGGDDD